MPPNIPNALSVHKAFTKAGPNQLLFPSFYAFPDSPRLTTVITPKPHTLLLVPTNLELARLADHGGFPPELARVEICGFGPIAAAARTAALVTALRPRHVVLIGIAGAYDTSAYEIGSALSFGSVAVDGIGAGEGDAFLGPRKLGFPQWPGSPETTGAVHEELELAAAGPLLLTTPSASGSAKEAARRTSRFPSAAAEDMEGFAVAMACSLANTPLRIVRGISNEVGVRNPAEWRIPAALGEARRVVMSLLLELAK